MTETLTTEAKAAPTVFDFLQEHGRLPRLGDSTPPWTYKGWALPYVQQIHQYHDDVPDRWGYLLTTLDKGKLLDDPIPEIGFAEADRGVDKLFDQWARIVNFDCGGWSDFGRLLDWIGWSLGVNAELPHLKDETHEKLYRTVNLGPLLVKPHDYVGDWISQRRAAGWNPTAFFPTPHQIVELMVRMTMADAVREGEADGRAKTVCDPCLGTGRMLLHASNYSLCLYGMDIDPFVLLGAKINFALYAPWAVFPLPESVVGHQVPAPPPAPLPVPIEHQPPEGVPVYRADDKGQMLLFPEDEPRPRKKRA